MKRHSWIKIGRGKKECVRCGIVSFAIRANDGYNTIWKYYYKSSPGNILDQNPGCK